MAILSDQESPFYQSDRFHALLVWVQQHATQVNMKEKQTKGGLRLRLAFKDIQSVHVIRETRAVNVAK